jgi:RHS repeat-associated protein
MSRARLLAPVVVMAAALAADPAMSVAADPPSSPAWAQKQVEGLTPGGDAPVDLHNGSFHHRIGLEVPAFHEVAPDLALTFNSSSGNGFAGVGWSLHGPSVIERVGPSGHGSRTCAIADAFILDGEPLVPCTALGGTHCTKQESFRRIRFDAAADRWTIWDTDGTRSTYVKTFHAGSCAYRYGLESVQDTRGNRVDYTWFTDLPGVHQEVYPATVRYNGVTVTFFRESRPDPVSHANGFAWSEQRLRLRSVLVTVNAGGAAGGGAEQRLRAYQLVYDTSPTTGRSRLLRVAQYGRDAAIDAAGAITGGSVLATQTFAYGGGTAGFSPTGIPGGFADAGGWNDVSNYSTIQTPDIDGDGRADVCARANAGIYCARFNGQGWAAFPRMQASPGWSDTHQWNKPQYYSTIRFPDLNGDGKADICGRGSAGLHCLLNDGAASPAFSTSLPMLPFPDTGGWDQPKHYATIQFADVNGDGKDDACYRSGAGVACRLMSASGVNWGISFDGPGLTDDAGWGAANKYSTIRFPDINGDGKADLCARTEQGIRCRLSTGTAFGGTEWLGPDWSDDKGWDLLKHYTTIQYPDVNGDGKADVCGRTAVGVHCYLAIGSARVQAPFQAFNAAAITTTEATDAVAVAPEHYQTLQYADINGDGRQDLCWRGAGGLNCARSLGNSFVRVSSNVPAWTDAAGWNDPGNYSAIRVVDLDGDGKADLFGRANDGLRANRTNADGLERLVAITNNGIGGRVDITYEPSSTFANVNNPPIDQVVTSITVDDGRGQRAATRFHYQGGRYDRAAKRSLGFRHVKRTLPLIPGEEVAPYEERWFMQAPYACVGELDFLKRSTGAGRLLVYSQRLYQSGGTGAGPFTCLLDQRSDHIYDSSGNTTCSAQDNTHCKRTDVNHDYDEYGNVTVTYDYGDYFDPADDTTTEAFLNRNVPGYIVDTPMVERLHPGIGTAAAMIGETRTFYDGATNVETPPAVGLATMVQQWVSDVGGPSPGQAYVVRRQAYDGRGNVVSEEDGLGRRTSYTYDGVFHQFPVGTTNPLGHTGGATWDTVCGVPLTRTDANGQVSRFQYDAFCRLTRTDEPLGGFSITSYSPLGNAQAHWTRVETPPVAGIPGNVYQVSHLDGLGRTYRTQQRGPDPAVADDILVDTTFDLRGNTRTRSLPRPEGAAAQVVTSNHDELDRPVKTTHADGNVASTGYHLWTTISTDEVARQVARTTDAAGRLVSVSEREGGQWHVARFSYDPRGNPVRTVDPAGNVTTYRFNSLDQELSQSDPDLGPGAFTYDANGRLLTAIDGRGQRTELVYDPLGRISRRTLDAGGEQPEVVSYSYDEPRGGFFNVGLRTSMRDRGGTATYDHDAAGRQVKHTRSLGGISHTFHQGYDAGDRLTGARYADGDRIGDDPTTAEGEPPLGYDGAGRLRAIPGLVDGVSYQAGGQVARIANANGTVSTRSHSPARDWLDSIKTARGGVRVQDLTFARDGEGKITGVASPQAGDGWRYGYDLLGRLARATRTSGTGDDEAFTYDKLGNLTSSRAGVYSYPPAGAPRPHAVTSIGPRVFRYDPAGNMTEGNGRMYQWDGANRLVRVARGNSVTTFVYDGEGDRLEKNHDGAVTRYVGDDYELGPDGTVTKYFRVGGELVAKKAGSRRFWIHGNHVDSVAVITDENGNEVRRQSQRAYGQMLETVGEHDESFAFTGQRQDETGLLFLHARYYDPEIGRFLSPDTETPGDLIIGLNRFAYANNDPINYTDPTGHVPWSKILKPVAVGIVGPLITLAPRDVGKTVATGIGSVGGSLAGLACGPGAPVCTRLGSGFGSYGSAVGYDAYQDWIHEREVRWGDYASDPGNIMGGALSMAYGPLGDKVAGRALKGRGGKIEDAMVGEAVTTPSQMAAAKWIEGDPEARWIPPAPTTKHWRQKKADDQAARMELLRALDEIFTCNWCAPRPPSAPVTFNFLGERYYPRLTPNGKTRPTPPRPTAPPARRGGSGCFVAGTRVTMADGTQKAIDEIRVGERVLALDEKTAKLFPAPVTEVFVHPAWRDQSATILVNGRLRATDNHPFFVNGQWRRADELQPGDLLRVLTPAPADPGPHRTTVAETVQTLAPLAGADTVYNLEVGGYHTYFAEGLLVHNRKTRE